MQDTNELIALVSGYEAYTDADELAVTAGAEAPATTPACLAWSVAFVFTGSVITIVRGC